MYQSPYSALHWNLNFSTCYSMGGDLKLVDLAASNTDTLVDSDVTVYPIHIDQGWTMLLYV